MVCIEIVWLPSFAHLQWLNIYQKVVSPAFCSIVLMFLLICLLSSLIVHTWVCTVKASYIAGNSSRSASHNQNFPQLGVHVKRPVQVLPN